MGSKLWQRFAKFGPKQMCTLDRTSGFDITRNKWIFIFCPPPPPPFCHLCVYWTFRMPCFRHSNNSNNFTEPLWGSVLALVLMKATTWLEAGIRIAFQRSEGVCGMNGKGNGAWKGRCKKRGWMWNMVLKWILVGETNVENLLINL